MRATVDGLRAGGGTATGDALTAALDRLQARAAKAPTAIVLLSDGKRTTGADPLAAARRAAQLHIPIYTVALGSASGTVYGPHGEPLAVPPDPETLRTVATTSGGAAYQAAGAKALEDVYKRLGSRIGTRREPREVTVGFVAVGLVALAGGVGLGVRRRGALV